ncbi:MAG: helix-hairpin-helix domain-containing protein [Deltaproteobacteria bacterium]|nr:helix-hairpin-helix domain-containing protein [Deltaproteobacteria bacterium]
MKRKRTMMLIFAAAVFFIASISTVALSSESETGKIDLNKATVEELLSLKGIGQAYAERIVDYREKNGPFKNIDDILMVKGIGEKTFEAIKDQLIITGETQE